MYGKGDAGEAIEALNYLSNKDTPTKPVQSPQSLRQEFYKSRRPVIEQTGDALNAHKKLPPLEVTPEFIALKKDFYKQRRERFLTDRPSELSAEFAAGAHGNTIGQRAVGGMNMGMAGLMLYRAIHEMNSSGEKSGFKKGAITIDLLNAGAMTASEVRWPRLIGQEWA